MKTTRLDYLDAIAGLLIVRMILGHLFQCCLLTETETYWWMNTVFSFFMPWFFYKSGMLFVISVGVNDCNSIFYIKLRGQKDIASLAVFLFTFFSCCISSIGNKGRYKLSTLHCTY